MTLDKLPRFDDELEEIIQFIAEDSINRALSFYDELILKIENIPINPFIYRKRQNTEDENIRELIFKGYVIPFYIDKESDKIVVLGIFNQNLWDIPS
jgi:plasmid stabilization system protein ParE